MRHGKKINHLGRKSAHRKAMLANMASSLIKHKRIKTTVAKAKALRKFVEPLITKSKSDTTHSRRVVFSYLRDKEAIKELFGPVATAVASRPGGYTRILKIGNRAGDNAEMALIELVDFNEMAPGKASSAGSSKRRRRSKKKSGDSKKAAPAAAAATEAVETAEEVVTDTAEAVAEESGSLLDKAKDAAAAVADKVEDIAEDVADAVEDAVEAVEEKVEDIAEAIEDKVEDIVGDDDDDDDKKEA